MSNNNFSIKRFANIPWQEIDNKILILSPQEATAHELNETASYIWTSIGNEISFHDLLHNICQEFDVSENIAKQDLIDIIQEFETKKLIICTQENP